MVGTTKNDRFNSKAGDVLKGAAGDDTYILWDNTARAEETANHGIDTVVAQFWGAAVLANNIENLVLASKGSIAGKGNALDNIITAGVVGAELNGMGGNDVLVGGKGGDIFRVAAGNGSDKVVGFQTSHDVIKLDGYGIGSFQDLLSMGKQEGGDVRFTFANKEQLVLQGTSLSSLNAWDFGFAMNQSTGGAGYTAPAVGTTTFVDPGRAQNYNGWYALNNAWGVGAMKAGKDYTLETTFNKADMTAGTSFNWSMPHTTALYAPILAYPEVIFGVSPMGAYSGNPTDKAHVFPVKIADLVSLKADYDVSYAGNAGGFNVSYDIWLTSKPNGDRSTITNEIMVWVHKGDFPPFGDVVGTFKDGNLTATIYHKGTYTAVVFDGDVLKAELDLTKIFGKLAELGIVRDNEYLASVELGAEVVSGVGSLTINNLDLEVKTRGDNGTVVVKDVTGAGTTVYEERPATAGPVFQPGVEKLFNDDGVVIGSKVTTLDAAGATQKFLDLNGRVLNTDKIAVNDQGAATTTHFDAAGQFLGAETSRTDAAGKIMTDHFSPAWKFTGSESIATLANGQVQTIHFGADWKVLGSETVIVESANRVVTNHFDAAWKFTGSDVRVTEATGAVSVQHFNKNWQFAGQDTTTVAPDGTVTTQHFASNWKFSGMEVEQTGTNGVVSTGVYDANWRLVQNEYDGTMANDTIKGSSIANVFHGGLGSDTLTGGAGADSFFFDTLIGRDVDRILDFSTAKDTIVLDDAIFTGIKTLGSLSASAFVTGTAATDANDRIIYDAKSGSVFYDSDGTGAAHAVLFATVQSDHPLTALDFIAV